MEIKEADLKYIYGCALTGLLANPLYSSVEGQKYLRMKNKTLESLAGESAIEALEVICKLKEALDMATEQKKENINSNNNNNNNQE